VIVVDASALIELLLPSDAAGAVAARLFDSGDSVAAPYLIDVETGSSAKPQSSPGRLPG